MFNWLKKRAILKSYARQLPLSLKKRFGKHKRYSAEQIRASIQKDGFDNSCIEYAYAMFMSRTDFLGLKHKNKDLEDYNTLRKKIAKSFFGGNTSFTIHDVLQTAFIPKKWMQRFFHDHHFIAAKMIIPEISIQDVKISSTSKTCDMAGSSECGKACSWYPKKSLLTMNLTFDIWRFMFPAIQS